MRHPLITMFAGLLASTILFSLVGGAFGAEVGKSVFWGCAVFAVPTLYFTHYAFRYTATGNCNHVARSFYWGQSSKFSLVLLGFALVFVFAGTIVVPALFAGFCLMIPAHLLVATFVSKNFGANKH